MRLVFISIGLGLAASPSAVMVEVSRERSNMTIPMSPPVHCGGLSNISIQLAQPEVAQTVLLRLFKPKDSNNLGLSQIRLLGSTTFSEAAFQGLTTDCRSLESRLKFINLFFIFCIFRRSSFSIFFVRQIVC